MRQVDNLSAVEPTGPNAALGELSYGLLNLLPYNAVVHLEKGDDFGSSALRLSGMPDAQSIEGKYLLLEKINPLPKLTVGKDEPIVAHPARNSNLLRDQNDDSPGWFRFRLTVFGLISLSFDHDHATLA